MRKIELLVPAKNLEGGIAAINYGADAIYIGAPKFGARAAATNSLEEIGKLIDYAHKYRVKVYITLNTILYDNELHEVQLLIHKLYELGADALIIQDLGILEMELPPIALHASTQTHNYDLDRIKFLEEAGFERIILARELSLEQLKEIRQATKVQLEYFVHGALCVSHSGQCYFSQAITKRSANRGECSQPCRMQYNMTDSTGRIIAKNKHLLSLKDLNLSENLNEIIDSGICSLKIEGRLKDISYIKNITSHYNKKLDSIISLNNDLIRSSSGRTRIKFTPDPQRTFNRGFTQYFFRGRSKGIANFNTPKSIGKEAGIVKEVFNDHFIYSGEESLHNGDGLCFYDSNNILMGIQVNKAEGNRIYPKEIGQISKGCILYRNYDHEFIKLLKRDSSQRKVEIIFNLLYSTRGVILSVTDEDGIEVTRDLEGIFEMANNIEMAENNINRQLSRTGDSIFQVKSINLKLTPLPFIPAKELTELRRQTLSALEEKRLKHHKRSMTNHTLKSLQYPIKQIDYSCNVANRNAESFYIKCGVKYIEPAFELQNDFKGKTLMTTRHCLRFEFNLCPHNNHKKDNIIEPLYLSDSRNRYKLDFDCNRCEMKIIWDSKI